MYLYERVRVRVRVYECLLLSRSRKEKKCEDSKKKFEAALVIVWDNKLKESLAK